MDLRVCVQTRPFRVTNGNKYSFRLKQKHKKGVFETRLCVPDSSINNQLDKLSVRGCDNYSNIGMCCTCVVRP